MSKEIIRKEFNFDIEFWNKTVNFKYKQGLIIDFLEFINLEDWKQRLKWYIDFLEKTNTDWKFSREFLSRYIKSFQKIQDKIRDTYFRWCFSKKQTTVKIDIWETLASLSDIIGISLVELIWKYTFEQASYESFWKSYLKVKYAPIHKEEDRRQNEIKERNMLNKRKLENMSEEEEKKLKSYYNLLENWKWKTLR